jgi:hypothetical protein
MKKQPHKNLACPHLSPKIKPKDRQLTKELFELIKKYKRAKRRGEV